MEHVRTHTYTRTHICTRSPYTQVRKWSDPVDNGANMLIPVPGGADGPGGVLVCAENFIIYKNQDHEEVGAPEQTTGLGSRHKHRTICMKAHPARDVSLEHVDNYSSRLWAALQGWGRARTCFQAKSGKSRDPVRCGSPDDVRCIDPLLIL
eukprot:918144-Pelagomonas_calceolata.AAC.4